MKTEVNAEEIKQLLNAMHVKYLTMAGPMFHLIKLGEYHKKYDRDSDLSVNWLRHVIGTNYRHLLSAMLNVYVDRLPHIEVRSMEFPMSNTLRYAVGMPGYISPILTNWVYQKSEDHADVVVRAFFHGGPRLILPQWSREYQWVAGGTMPGSTSTHRPESFIDYLFGPGVSKKSFSEFLKMEM